MTRFNGKKVLILGSGGLRIGQAGEFDYSGSQAIKALKEEGIYTVLVNPNIATVQTDAEMADEVYLQPLTTTIVTEIIAKERPDAILLGFGGQTALNLGLALEEAGVLAQYGVQVLGTQVAAIRQTEDRDIFKSSLERIHIKTPRSFCVTTTEAALAAAEQMGYPVMMRSGFSLGGLGSGKISSAEELQERAQECFTGSPQILIEEYLFGWKEFEYEIVRDAAGNTLTICNMENMDAMGIHTGESIVVAPAQTLTNAEHQQLRNIAIQAANYFNIIGECNIQFAINPQNGDYRVIEINARLSRSSALASKATGYPLAFVATKLALGWLLYEIKNNVTQQTCAFFEPALDYLVVKIPRWDTQKLKSAGRTIGTEMKSVGEVMGIGRSFPEALQKAVGMLNIGASCLSDYPRVIDDAKDEIANPTDRRLFALYQFFMSGGTLAEAQQLSQIDAWFLFHIEQIAIFAKQLQAFAVQPKQHGPLHEVAPLQRPIEMSDALLREAKKLGFSDRGLAHLCDYTESAIRAHRIKRGITPVVKQIDTLAGEFAAQTNYLYLTYHGTTHDITALADRPVLILGSGPYAIGSSVEFDWCAVNTARTLRKLGKKAVIINSNPETVSTDYDESDRLYFEQLTFERVQDIADFEQPAGLIVSVGGQIANNLALPLATAGYPLLGTAASDIDRAEDREKFSALLHELNIDQPAWQKVTNLENAKKFAKQMGYPVLIRPSYILSGAAMNVAYDDVSLQAYLLQAAAVSSEHPVVISKFIQDAKELEIDGVARNGEIVIEAINEHVENAGVHSGDATLVLPPQNLYLETIRRTKKITRKIVRALRITGPFNIQFIAKNNHIQVIECNLRASRSLPFVSKVTNHHFIEIATQAMLGIPTLQHYETLELDYVGVKAPQFSYQRLKGADPVQQVEMASTGEVACLGEDLYHAFWLAWLASEQPIVNNRLLVSIADPYKEKLLPALKELEVAGWRIYSTEGTHSFLFKNGIASYFVYKASVNKEPNIQTIITQRQVDMIINVPSNNRANIQTDGFKIRRLAIDHHIPLITNAQKAQIMLQCLINLKNTPEPVRSWREIVEGQQSEGSSQLRLPPCGDAVE
ncbi:MAG TPA: carbamoyl-phosphate synthase (glutamine-hydrolyzing) large subunit [Gammaproteobacteria bacterium]|nr:carbamoyl-phosphate synthase (glutamine-hydrolyzing) large subunit [Gammaproteobacteria bacterium]